MTQKVHATSAQKLIRIGDYSYFTWEDSCDSTGQSCIKVIKDQIVSFRVTQSNGEDLTVDDSAHVETIASEVCDFNKQWRRNGNIVDCIAK